MSRLSVAGAQPLLCAGQKKWTTGQRWCSHRGARPLLPSGLLPFRSSQRFCGSHQLPRLGPLTPELPVLPASHAPFFEINFY